MPLIDSFDTVRKRLISLVSNLKILCKETLYSHPITNLDALSSLQISFQEPFALDHIL